MDFLNRLSSYCSAKMAEFTVSSLDSKNIEVKIGFIRYTRPRTETFWFIKTMSATMCPVETERMLVEIERHREFIDA